MSERALLIFSDDNDSMEALQTALNSIRHAPYKPNAVGTPYGSKQEQYTEQEVNDFAIKLLREAAPHLNWGGSVIVP